MQINTDVFNTFPILKTERLTLRDIRITDAEEIYKMRASGRVNQFIARNNMSNFEDSKLLIEKTNTAFKNKMAIGWAGILRNNNAIIGTCGFNQIDYPNLRAEIGGELSVDYWGKNIAIEAVSTIIKFGLNNLNLHSIEAKVSPNNRGAIYLMEQLGFKKEAHFVDRIYFYGNFSDMAVYTLLKGNENFSF